MNRESCIPLLEYVLEWCKEVSGFVSSVQGFHLVREKDE
jgi:hypothetical protein